MPAHGPEVARADVDAIATNWMKPDEAWPIQRSPAEISSDAANTMAVASNAGRCRPCTRRWAHRKIRCRDGQDTVPAIEDQLHALRGTPEVPGVEVLT